MYLFIYLCIMIDTAGCIVSGNRLYNNNRGSIGGVAIVIHRMQQQTLNAGCIGFINRW